MPTTRSSRAQRLVDDFFDAAPIGMAILRLDDPADGGSFRVVHVNRMAAEIGTVPPDAMGKRLDEIAIVKDSELASLFLKVLRDNTATGMGEGPGLLDPSRHYAGDVFPIPPDAVGLVYYEVTAQRRNERQLARAQELAKMGSWNWQVGSDRVHWSEEMYRIYGLTPETFKGTLDGFLERVHPDDREMVQSSVRYALENGTPFHHQERIVRPSGDVRVLDSIGECILGPNGKAAQLVGLCRDITEDARAVQQLEESEQRFRKIFEASPAAICVFALDTGKLIDVNPRFVELVGYGSSGAIVGKRLDALGMWAEQGEFAKLVELLRQQRSVRETTVIYRTYGGQVRRALVALELIEIDGQERALGLFWRA
ncbi:MAG TPA: PAS domain S-box protein [Gemmatimonadales bacterium]|nr:PAS domain S-box protein [Gemmatimonadales bacterium]